MPRSLDSVPHRQAADRRGRGAIRYTWLGAALGVGAPLGFALLRRVLGRASPSVRRELADEALSYAYMAAATPIVFGLFGRSVGRQEDRLRAAHDYIEQLREEFTAVVAHDLRDPIQVIKLQVEMLIRDAKDDEVRVALSTLRRLERGAERLSQMVSDLLDASSVEADRLSLHLSAVSLPDAVAELVERIRPGLGTHPIATELDGTPPPVMADPVRLDQILTNLIVNAAKYSNESAPISVRIFPADGGAVVSVRDQGPGIAPEDVPRLFDRYYQSKRAREKKTGLGLGLYITKGLVEAQKGRIDVCTAPGRGSTFSVWLPGVLRSSHRLEARRSE